MPTRQTLLALVSLSSLLVVSLCAKGPQGNTPMGFAAYDTNKDGKITPDELEKWQSLQQKTVNKGQ